MNILPVQNFQIRNINIPQKTNFGLCMSSPLRYDTVSFGHVNKQAVTTGKEIVQKQVEKDIEHRLKRISNVFLAVTKSIADELKAHGIEFNKKYAAANPIKSAKSTAEKISRYGSFSIPDQIRTTLFSKNFYDLSILFEKILPKYQDCGYVVHDLEVTMEDISQKIKNIPEKYKQYTYEEPRHSGIEQIQIRFVREGDKAENPVKHELIIIPGYEYAKAKHYESKYIYSNTRQLGELNFIKKGSEKDINVIKAVQYTSVLKKILNLYISQPLFLNAKGIDLDLTKVKRNIDITDMNVQMVKNCFVSLEDCLKNYYKQAFARAKTEARIEELTQRKKEDEELLKSIKNNIIGSKKEKIEGAVNFFRNGEHHKDPFKNIKDSVKD